MNWQRAAALGFAMLACTTAVPSVDGGPPRVAFVDPPALIATGHPITITFSAPMDPASLQRAGDPGGSDTIALVRESDADELATSFDRPRLSQRARALTLPATLEVGADSTVAKLRPAFSLASDETYVLLVGRNARDTSQRQLVDDAGRPATFRRKLRVAAPPQASRGYLTFPAPGARNVPTNLRQLSVDAAAGAVSLVGDDGTIAPLTRVSGESVTLDAPSHGACDPLCPRTRYWLATETRGQLAQDGFVTADCAAPPLSMAPGIDLLLGDRSLRASWRQSGSGLAHLEAAPGDETDLALSCGAPDGGGGDATCLRGPEAMVDCAPDLCAPPGEPACVAGAELPGLSPDTDYAMRVVSTDGTGATVASDPLAAHTLPPQPRVVITEVMYHSAASPDAAGEFIEVVAEGDAAISLCDLTLSANGGAAKPLCTDQIVLLMPGQYAIVVGAAFDSANYALPPNAVVVHAATAALLGRGLPDRPPPTLALRSSDDVVVSTYSGFGDCRRGVSIERATPDAPDAPQSWHCAFGGEPPGSTPCAANEPVGNGL